MMRKWLLGSLLLLLTAAPASAYSLHVTLIPEVSDANTLRFEVTNASVDTLDVVRLTAIFYAGGRRLWAQPVSLNPSLLRSGESGWVSVDARMLPRQPSFRIDWELTWNPYYVPVLPKDWRTERADSIEISTAPPSADAGPPIEPRPATPPPALEPRDGDRWTF
jgi:hypothetical protein